MTICNFSAAYFKSVACSHFYEFNYTCVNKELFLEKVPKSHDKFSLVSKKNVVALPCSVSQN